MRKRLLPFCSSLLRRGLATQSADSCLDWAQTAPGLTVFISLLHTQGEEPAARSGRPSTPCAVGRDGSGASGCPGRTALLPPFGCDAGASPGPAHAHPLCRRSPAGEPVSWPGAWRSSGQGCPPPRWQPCWPVSLLRPAAWPPASPPPPRRAGRAGPRWGDALARPPRAGTQAGGCGAAAWGLPCRRCRCRWGSVRASLLRSQGTDSHGVRKQREPSRPPRRRAELSAERPARSPGAWRRRLLWQQQLLTRGYTQTARGSRKR